MKIDIITKNLELTAPLREYIEIKIGSLEKFLEKFKEMDLDIKIEVARTTKHHKQGEVFYAEGNIALPGSVLVASSESWDIRVAIDDIKNKLQREIRKYKGKADPTNQ
ncbi:MAG TPA: ribosome-associated translation inhibitor RaiA [Candidatus Paceibacterota bacterium]